MGCQVGWDGVMELQGGGEKEGENLNVGCPVSGAGQLSCLSGNSAGSIAHQLTTLTGS